jgi:hypothetical protein
MSDFWAKKEKALCCGAAMPFHEKSGMQSRYGLICMPPDFKYPNKVKAVVDSLAPF